MHFKGKLYRAINPIFAQDPLSGRGEALYGGRFNRKGTPALYTSLSIMTALREAIRLAICNQPCWSPMMRISSGFSMVETRPPSKPRV